MNAAGSQKKHVPIRTCISCGNKRPKKELKRLVLGETGCIRIDHAMVEKGRGAYVCDGLSCRMKLKEHRNPAKMFRARAPVRLSGELSAAGEACTGFSGVDQKSLLHN